VLGQTRRARRAQNPASAEVSPTTDGIEIADGVDERMRDATAADASGTRDAGALDAVTLSAPTLIETVVGEVMLAAGAELAADAESVSSRPRSRRELRALRAALTPCEPEANAVAEPAVAEPVVEGQAAEEPAAFETDAFETAARLFSFTGETPVVVSPAAAAEDESAETPASDGSFVASEATGEATDRANTAHRRRRRAARGKSPARRLAAASLSVGVMGAVGMLALATAAPAEAIAAAVKTEPVTSIQAPEKEAVEAEIQAYAAPADIDVDLHREGDTYAVASLSEIAASVGITRHTNFFVNDPNGLIQWPFAVGVPISDGYGPRWGGMHNGLDFTPGEGAEIQAVAAGTVRIASESGGAFGVHVMIDHEINGEVFSTHYAHMQYGSIKVTQGQQVEAGTILGLVGDTGLSYGAHLHFEVYIGESRIDPLAWLREHAGG